MEHLEQVGEITENILHFHMSTQAAMIDTFLRPQERAECRNEEFRTRPFTVGEYRKWYVNNSAAIYDYPSMVLGVNFPSHILKPFLDGEFDPLTRGEQDLIASLRGRSEPFYVIGTHGKIDNTLDHEICHGLFYTDKAYRKAVLKAIDEKVPKKTKRAAFKVLAADYNDDVLLDELHAYLATGHRDFFGDAVEFAPETVNHFVRLKQKAFARHGINVDKIAAGIY